MINLLPPEVKNQIVFSKRNGQMVKLITALAIAGLVLGGMLFGGTSYLKARNLAAEKELNATLHAPATEIEKTVNATNKRLATIKKLQQSKHSYSSLLRDLASVLPPGTFINSVNLTGEDKPLKLNVSATTYSAATKVRDSLATLHSRIEAVDIESISLDGNNYTVTLNIAFVKGQAK